MSSDPRLDLPTPDDADVQPRLASIHVYPVKSCGGLAVDTARVIETGLEWDRCWMVVDADGEFVTQRELPRMAFIRPALKLDSLVLRAPGMLALHLSLEAAEAPCRVRVWNDEVQAYDMGSLAAQWFSDCLRQPLRLVRFDPAQRRLSSPRWTQGTEAENAFSDGYPITVVSQASLDELNRRLAARGQAPVGLERFRANLVLDDVNAHDEDHLDTLVFPGEATAEAEAGPVALRVVKPCPRCPIPNIDPATAESGPEPGDTLSTYRADARVDGAISFAMNAVRLEGLDRVLRVGARGAARYRFA